MKQINENNYETVTVKRKYIFESLWKHYQSVVINYRLDNEDTTILGIEVHIKDHLIWRSNNSCY